jgi:hypothetical protein
MPSREMYAVIVDDQDDLLDRALVHLLESLIRLATPAGDGHPAGVISRCTSSESYSSVRYRVHLKGYADDCGVSRHHQYKWNKEVAHRCLTFVEGRGARVGVTGVF